MHKSSSIQLLGIVVIFPHTTIFVPSSPSLDLGGYFLTNVGSLTSRAISFCGNSLNSLDTFMNMTSEDRHPTIRTPGCSHQAGPDSSKQLPTGTGHNLKLYQRESFGPTNILPTERSPKNKNNPDCKLCYSLSW